VGVGESCLIRGAIIDKNARIGDNSIIANTENQDNCDGENYYIRDQIVIISKDSVIMPGTVI
jgi:glucose-1-phosphate adenylyltransferase